MQRSSKYGYLDAISLVAPIILSFYSLLATIPNELWIDRSFYNFIGLPEISRKVVLLSYIFPFIYFFVRYGKVQRSILKNKVFILGLGYFLYSIFITGSISGVNGFNYTLGAIFCLLFFVVCIIAPIKVKFVAYQVILIFLLATLIVVYYILPVDLSRDFIARYGFYYNPNAFAVLPATLFIFSCNMIFFGNSNKSQKFLYFICVLISVLFLLAAASRGVIICSVTSVLLFLLCSKGNKILIYSALLIVVLMLFFEVFSSFGGGTFDFERSVIRSEGIEARLNGTFVVPFKFIAEQHFLPAGFNAPEMIKNKYNSQLDSSYLYHLASSGLIGFTLLALFYIHILKEIKHAFSKKVNSEHSLLFCISSSYIIYYLANSMIEGGFKMVGSYSDFIFLLSVSSVLAFNNTFDTLNRE